MRYLFIFAWISCAFLNSCGDGERKTIHFGPGPSMEDEEAASKEEVSQGEKA